MWAIDHRQYAICQKVTTNRRPLPAPSSATDALDVAGGGDDDDDDEGACRQCHGPFMISLSACCGCR